MDKRTLELGWNKNHSKAIQGICAVGIIFHHMAQKTCAPWLAEEYIFHGLDPFLNLGFLFVAVFFFCSGFGLYKSIKANPDYLKGFIGRHFRPIILLWLFSNYCFLMVDQELNHYCWFIYAILYLYLAFYITCKKFKSDRSRIICLSIFIILYIAFCELTVAGTWTYNTIGVFLAGWFFSKYEEQLVTTFRKNWWLWLILTFVILLSAFFGAQFMTKVSQSQTNKTLFNVFRIGTVVLQFTAALAFPIFLFILSQKVQIKNKACVFLGSITLEIYLFHVLFVEIFSYYFVNPKKDPICYIPNVFLYALVVVSLSILTAYALTWVRKGAWWLYQKYNHIFTALHRDFKKIVIIVVSILVGITALVMLNDRIKMPERKEKVAAYIDENLQIVPVEGKDMAVYVTGNGEKSILILRGLNDPCPTLLQRALADTLSKDYKVIVPDFFGNGFSAPFDSERTAANICQELHTLAQTFELSNYILIAEGTSSLLAQYYVNAYPGEVSNVMTIDAESTKLLRATLAANNGNLFDYFRNSNLYSRSQYVFCRAINFLSYKLFIWPWIQGIFAWGIGQSNYDLAYDIYFARYFSAADKNERLHDYQTYMETETLKYPANVNVIDLVSEDRRKGFATMGINIDTLSETLCENPENHKTVIIVDAMYCIVEKTDTIRTQLNLFMEEHQKNQE